MSDRKKVVLTLRCCVFNKVIVGQLLRTNKHGCRHLNRIVKRERGDELRRRAVHSCESFGELCTCLETAQNIVEKCDLLMRIVAGSGREKVGDAIDYSQPVPRAGGRERADKLIEHRLALRKSNGSFGVRTDWHGITCKRSDEIDVANSTLPESSEKPVYADHPKNKKF